MKFENKKQRVKLLLLSGRKLTVSYLDDLLKTNNSPEIIRRLRKEMNIRMEWKKRNGSRYGVYSYSPAVKVDRIKTREYLNRV